MTEKARDILGKNIEEKKPWITRDVFDLCDERRDLKIKRYAEKGAKEYRKANKMIQKALKTAKEDWMDTQCKEFDAFLNKNNSKKAYKLLKDLISEKQGRSTTIQDKSGKCLIEEQKILSADGQSIAQSYTTM